MIRSYRARRLSGILALVIAAAAIVALACGGNDPVSSGRDEGRAPAPAAAVTDRSAVPEAALPVYRFIEANQSLAVRLPCYCGCGETEGHRSLRECFLTDRGTYNPHGAGCAICQGEAQDAQTMLAQGLDAGTIRARIIERWAAFGPPTESS